MWQRTQHDILCLISECGVISEEGLLGKLNRSDCRPLRRTLKELQKLMLVRSARSNTFEATREGRAIADAKFAALYDLRTLWLIEDAGSPATADMLHQRAQLDFTLESLRSSLWAQKRRGHISAKKDYYLGHKALFYELNAAGKKLLEVYEPLRRLR